MPDNDEQLQERRAYLLDVSLFIFDVLNPEKILRSVSDGNAILEVPSAFVTLIWSSVSGDTLLQDLIYANLVGLRNNGTLSGNPSEQIRRWANATNEELRNFSQTVLQHILDFYSQFIDGTRRETQTRTFYPIRRYEPVLPDQSSDDLQKMRAAYIAEFGIRSHPLYDLYFLQIYHAQSEGIAASPLLPRVFVFLGRQAAGALSRWIGETDPRAINLNTRERYLRTLGWFVDECIADQFLDAAINGVLGIGVSFILTGTLSVNILAGVSVANFVRKAILDPVVKSPYLRKETDVPAILGIIVSVFGVCICLFLIWPGLRGKIFEVSPQLISPTPTTTQILTATTIGFITPSITPTIEPVTTIVSDTPIPASSIVTIEENSIAPVSIPFEVGYCLYVAQPGDTIQSIVSRFHVTENDLRAGDGLVSLETFTTNQMVRVNAACCSVINGQGFSYTVQRGENLFRIAENNSTSFEYLALVNNLYDPRCIQAGQMLCIPYP